MLTFLPQPTVDDWLAFFQQVGLATAIIFALGFFFVRYGWPYITRKIDDLTQTVDRSLELIKESQALFVSALNAQRESHLNASEKQNEIFERTLQGQRDESYKLMTQTFQSVLDRMSAHDREYIQRMDSLAKAMTELSRQIREAGVQDAKTER